MNIKTIDLMKETGGDFEKALAEAWLKADDINRGKLTTMFPEFEKFNEDTWNLKAKEKEIFLVLYYNLHNVRKCRDLILKDLRKEQGIIPSDNTYNIITKRFGDL